MANFKAPMDGELHLMHFSALAVILVSAFTLLIYLATLPGSSIQGAALGADVVLNERLDPRTTEWKDVPVMETIVPEDVTGSNEVGIVMVGNSANSGLSDTGAIKPKPVQSVFLVEDKKGRNLANWTEYQLILAGACRTWNPAGTIGSNEALFEVKNEQGQRTAFVDQVGNLWVTENCGGQSPFCRDEGGLVVQRSDGTIISTIDNAGRLCSTIDLIENGQP